MSFHNIPDFNKCAQELEDKYMKLDYHPGYTRHDYLVSGVTTPYWNWVVVKLEDEQDALDRDNPYNQY